MQPDQFRTGVEAELLSQQRAGLGVHAERLGLPAAAVERGHQLAAQGLPQRVLGDQRRQLGGDRVRLPGGQPQVGQPLQHREPAVVQRGRGGTQRPAVHAGQRAAAPERERRRQGGDLGAAGQLLEPGHVEPAGPGPDPVAASVGVDRAGDAPAQPADELVHLVHRGRRRLGVPERVDQRVEADDPAAGQQQRGQRFLGLRTADRDTPAAAADLDRAEEEELHAR